jgi:hypothetical protein
VLWKLLVIAASLDRRGWKKEAIAQTAAFFPSAVEGRDCDLAFFAGLWSGFSVCDADFNLSQHRHELLWLVPLDWHDL